MYPLRPSDNLKKIYELLNKKRPIFQYIYKHIYVHGTRTVNIANKHNSRHLLRLQKQYKSFVQYEYTRWSVNVHDVWPITNCPLERGGRKLLFF